MAFNVGAVTGSLNLIMDRWTGNVRQAKADSVVMKKHVDDIGVSARSTSAAMSESIGSIRNAIASVTGVLAAGGLTQQFISAASTMENFQIVLKKTIGDESKKLFDDMVSFAARVPASFKELMRGATMFSAVMKNASADSIGAWMRMASDLSSYAMTVDVSFQESMVQIIRMVSAGAASADLFREKGVSAMLGFADGVQRTAKETREALVKAWLDPESKFRGMSESMMKSWTGLMSNMGDLWFMFRIRVMDSGPFEAIKNGLASVNQFLSQNMDAIAGATIAYGKYAIAAAGVVAGLVAIKAASMAAGISMSGLGTLASVAFNPVLVAIAAASSAIYVWRAVWNQNLNGMRDVLTGFGNWIGEVFDAAWVSVSDFISKMYSGMTGMLGKTMAGIKEWGNSAIRIFDSAQQFWTTLASTGSLASARQAASDTQAMDYFGSIGSIATEAIDGLADGIKKKVLDYKAGAPLLLEMLTPSTEMVSALKSQLNTDTQSLFSAVNSAIADGSKEGAIKAEKAISEYAAKIAESMDSFGGGTGDKSKAASAASKASNALAADIEQLASKGQQFYDSMSPARKALTDLSEGFIGLYASLPGLDAAQQKLALLAAETLKIKGPQAATDLVAPMARAAVATLDYNEKLALTSQIFDKVRDKGDAAISAVGAAVRGIVPDLDAMYQSLKDTADIEWMQKDLKAAFADLNYDQIGTNFVQITGSDQLATLKSDLESISAQSRALTQDETSFLSATWAQRFSGLTGAAFDKMIAMLNAVGGAGQEAGRKAAKALEFSREQDNLSKLGSSISSIGSGISSLSNSMRSKFGQVVSAVVSGVGGMIGAVKDYKDAIKESADSGASGFMALLDPINLVVSAVQIASSVFGLFGDDAKKELTGVAKAVDDLKKKTDEWVDDITNAILDFVETGKMAVDELLNKILRDTAEVFIHEMISSAQGWIGDQLFAKGAAFNKGQVVPFAQGGGIVASPISFPMSGGKSGLMGEAGPEAIMPLKRMGNGSLGVSVAGGASPINVVVNDHRQSGEAVGVKSVRNTDGSQSILLTIRDAVNSAIADGGMDRAMNIRYGLTRRPA